MLEKIIYNSAGSSPDIKELLNADGRGGKPFPRGAQEPGAVPGSALGAARPGAVPRSAARGRGGPGERRARRGWGR